jgi:hypothetical protein
MAVWTETGWIYQFFDEIHETKRTDAKRWNQGIWETNHFRPNHNSLRKALDEIANHCNRTQTSIKAVVPLTRAQTHQYGQVSEFYAHPGQTTGAGLGYGWGFSNVIGLAVLTERIDEVTDEEYSRRLARYEAPVVAPPPLPQMQTA